MAGLTLSNNSYFYTKTRRFWAKRQHLAPLQTCYCTPKAYQLNRKQHAFGMENVEEKVE